MFPHRGGDWNAQPDRDDLQASEVVTAASRLGTTHQKAKTASDDLTKLSSLQDRCGQGHQRARSTTKADSQGTAHWRLWSRQDPSARRARHNINASQPGTSHHQSPHLAVWRQRCSQQDTSAPGRHEPNLPKPRPPNALRFSGGQVRTTADLTSMPEQRREYNRSEPKASHDRSRHNLPARKAARCKRELDCPVEIASVVTRGQIPTADA